MATMITKPNASSTFIFVANTSFPTFSSSLSLSFASNSKVAASKIQTRQSRFLANMHATPFSAIQENHEEIQEIRYIDEFDESLWLARDQLVLVAFVSSHIYQSIKVRQFMYEIATQSNQNVKLLSVVGDQTKETIKLCVRENITKIPLFALYKNMKKVHEEQCFNPIVLNDYLFYHGEKNSHVVQVRGREDVDKLSEYHADKMVVVNIRMNCGPCKRIYPTVIHLATQMSEKVVFAQMNADEKETCTEFITEMKVVKVPTFLFFKKGQVFGRYVGSNGGQLFREIINCQRVFQ